MQEKASPSRHEGLLCCCAEGKEVWWEWCLHSPRQHPQHPRTAPPALPKLSSSEEQGATWLPSMLESSGGTRQTWPHEPCWSEPKLLREAFYKHQSLLKHFPSAQPLCPKFLWFFLVLCSTSLKAPFDVHSCFSILELVCQKISQKRLFHTKQALQR